jgi:hypothetical protein
MTPKEGNNKRKTEEINGDNIYIFTKHTIELVETKQPTM